MGAAQTRPRGENDAGEPRDPATVEAERALAGAWSWRHDRRRVTPYDLLGTRARRVGVAVFTIVVLLASGAWMYGGVDRSLHQIRSAGLQAGIDAQAQALALWVEEKTAILARQAASPRWEDEANTGELLDGMLRERDAVAVMVMDGQGRVIDARPRTFAAVELAPGAAPRLAHLLDGPSRFLHSEAGQGVFRVPRSIAQSPLVWLVARLPATRDGGARTVVIAKRAEGQFANVIGAWRLGETGEAYAFSASGVMLSPSRFGEALRAARLAPAGASSPTALQVELRDPGGPLASGFEPSLERAEWPLTALMLSARAGTRAAESQVDHGVLLEPYRNYLGTPVIGAWRWMPEYDLGLAVEIGAEEAYAPLRYVNAALGVTFGLLILFGYISLVSSFSVAQMRQEASVAKKLGPYRIEKEIGEGGMSTVYLAHHALLKRPTALKILKAHIATDEVIARFEREVRLASRLSHPNTIEIYDYGRTRDGVFYYAMELLDGLTLAELVERDGPLPTARVVHVMRQVCASLREAHEQGLVHRDIKPHNIMLCRHGGEFDVAKVLDFGLVKKVEGAQTRDLTRFLRVLGTPLYMAPERIRSPSDVDARADVYSVGATAFNLLTARSLFESESDLDLTHHVLHTPAPHVRAYVPDVPEALDALIAACLEKDRALRPASAEAVKVELAAIGAGLPWTRAEAVEWWSRWPG